MSKAVSTKSFRKVADKLNKHVAKTPSKVITKAVKGSKVAKNVKVAKSGKTIEQRTKEARKAGTMPPAKVVSTNPYRVGGAYWATVEGLKALGVGKLHAFDKIVAAVTVAMKAEKTWAVFAAKGARNEATAKDTEGRIIQNVSVVARADYGKALRDVGFEVRFNGRDKVAGLFKL